MILLEGNWLEVLRPMFRRGPAMTTGCVKDCRAATGYKYTCNTTALPKGSRILIHTRKDTTAAGYLYPFSHSSAIKLYDGLRMYCRGGAPTIGVCADVL